MEDAITVKVSGTAVYKAVKQYLDNSTQLQDSIKVLVDKHLEVAVKGRIQSILDGLEMQAKYKIKQELETLVKKEVEAKVASYIAAGVKRMFEGETVTAKVTEVIHR